VVVDRRIRSLPDESFVAIARTHFDWLMSGGRQFPLTEIFLPTYLKKRLRPPDPAKA
jgi:hypothetical protein